MIILFSFPVNISDYYILLLALAILFLALF